MLARPEEPRRPHRKTQGSQVSCRGALQYGRAVRQRRGVARSTQRYIQAAAVRRAGRGGASVHCCVGRCGGRGVSVLTRQSV